ncbi:MAG: hypothetical protein AAB594_03560 [Patescibacteria group bacterium]
MKEKVNQFSDLNKNRRRRRFLLKIYLSIFAGGLVIAALVWLVINLPLLKFKTISSNASETQIGEKLIEVVKTYVQKNSLAVDILGPNHFFIWPKSLTGKEIGFPELDKIEIRKNYLSQALLISILEKDTAGIWCLRKESDFSSPRCWLFDRSGKIFKESLSTSGNLIKVVDDYSQENLNLNSKILPDPMAENMVSILVMLSETSLSPRKIEILDLKPQEVEVSTFNGPKIYFSLRRKADIYLEILNALAKESNFASLAYVDLRVENRVYTRK